MANKTILIVREPNVEVPEAYLRKVIAACPNGGGYAVQSKNDKGEPELITDNDDTSPVLSDVQDFLKGYASHRVLMAFNKLEKMDEKFLQPWHVAIDGDDVLLSFGIDGSFPKMIEAGSTEESLLAQRVMFPNLQKLIKGSAGDLDKFLAELRDPIFIEMVMSRVDDRGAFCFFPPAGDPIWLGKNTLGSTFPWGQTSDTLGYTETPAAATSAVGKGKAKPWWGKGKPVPVAQDAAPAAPEKPADPPPVEVPRTDPASPAKPDTRVNPPSTTPDNPPITPPPGHWEAIPKGTSRDQRKKLIRRVTNCGSVLPEGWDKDPFYYWVAEYPQNSKMVELAHKSQVMKAETATASTPSPRSGADIAKSRVDLGDPLMLSKEEMTAIEEHTLRVLGKISKTPPDLLANQKAEEKYAKFSQQFGIKLELLHNWTPADIRLLGPKGLFHYALELRRNAINAAAGASPAEAQNGATEALKAEAPTSSAAPAIKGWGKKPKAA